MFSTLIRSPLLSSIVKSFKIIFIALNRSLWVDGLSDVTIQGNLTVTGDRIEAQVGSLQVADHTITVGSGSTTSATMNQAGLDFGVSGSVAFLRYDHSTTNLSSSVDLIAPQLHSTIATGTAPLTVSSTTEVSNLNNPGIKSILHTITSNKHTMSPVEVVEQILDLSGAMVVGESTKATLMQCAEEGGDFEMDEEDEIPRFEEGSIIVFPSFLKHRVTPVTKGVRYSLVSWFVGPPFI